MRQQVRLGTLGGSEYLGETVTSAMIILEFLHTGYYSGKEATTVAINSLGIARNVTSVMARKPLQPLLSLLKGILILPTLDSFGMACQSYIFPCGEGIDNFTEFVQSRVSVIRARCNGRLFARITGSLMQPQFTHRVLGIRSWTLPLESHQFCMSRSATACTQHGRFSFLSVTVFSQTNSRIEVLTPSFYP